MLPAAYATPAAVIITLGGVLACFFGYRLFRVVLGVYGFVAGAMIATQMMGPSSSVWTLSVAALVGGVLGGALMVAAYFIGVGLVGAGLALLAVHLGWTWIGGADPPTWALIIAAVLGALGALSVVRFVVILGTATAGAWTIIVGVLALMGDEAARRAANAGDVWIFYPLDPVPDRWWYTLAWVVLLVIGVVVQSATSKRGKRRAKRAAVAA